MNIKVKEINPKAPDYIRGKPNGSYIRELISTLLAANRTDEKQSDEDLKKDLQKDFDWHFPPITIIKNKDPKQFIYTIIDGVHRLAAAKRLKLKEIPAKVLEANTTPANAFLLQYNSQDQGLRLNVEQRNLAIKKMVKQYKIPVREVGKATGLHWTSVARIAAGKQATVKGGEQERKKIAVSKPSEIPDEIFSPEIFFERIEEIIDLGTEHKGKISGALSEKSYIVLLEKAVDLIRNFLIRAKPPTLVTK